MWGYQSLTVRIGKNTLYYEVSRRAQASRYSLAGSTGMDPTGSGQDPVLGLYGEAVNLRFPEEEAGS
jgi:hypothetical protein